jgi:hypothetical protein
VWVWGLGVLAIAAHLVVTIVHFAGNGLSCQFRELFDPAESESFAAYFMAGLLVFSGGLALLRASRQTSRFRMAFWLVLGLGFLLFALTRVTDLHRDLLMATGVAGRIIVLGTAAIAAIMAAPAVFTLDRRTRYVLIAAAILYVAGAVVIDGLNNLFPQSAGLDACQDHIRSLAETLSETLESALELAAYLLLATGLRLR